MVNEQSEINEERLVRIARIVEDVAKIHALHDEINELQDIPTKLKTYFNILTETRELLSQLKVSSITHYVPWDYEDEYTKIERGTAYVKIGGEWTAIGFIREQETIMRLVEIRREIIINIVSILDDIVNEEENGKICEISNKTFAVMLRNIAERFLFDEEDLSGSFEEMYASLESVYLTIKKIIENRQQKEIGRFNREIDDEIEKANGLYQKYMFIKKNRSFEARLKELLNAQAADLDMYLDEIYKTMPDYYTDPNGLLAQILGIKTDREESTMDALVDQLEMLSPKSKEKKVGIKEEIIEKLNENKKRAENTFCEYFWRREEEKAKEQMEIIRKISRGMVREELEGIIEDISVIRRLKKQIERMRLSDETKVRFASITETMELLHLLKTGIINQEHNRNFWTIEDGVAYLKTPSIKLWNADGGRIRLGHIIEERETAIRELNTQRTFAFENIRECLAKDIEGMDSRELSDLLESIGRRLALKQQSQHYEIIKLEEVVWNKLKEMYEEERKEKEDEEFALKSDEIARRIIATAKYIEEMKTENEEAKRIGSKMKDEMYSMWIMAKKENILRLRSEKETYLEAVETVSDMITMCFERIDEIENFLGPKQKKALFREAESIDPDKVLLKGAKDKAFPLIENMRKIIEMIKEEHKDDEGKKERLEVLFEVSAILLSKFVARFQVPYVLKEEGKGAAVRPLNYGESVFMLGGLIDFLDVLYRWEKIRTPYYNYKIETKKTIERITEETLCPAIANIEDAYGAVDMIARRVGESEEIKKDVAETVCYIANKVMAIDFELEKKGESLSKEDQLRMISILYIASAYAGTGLYKQYADERYEEPLLRIIDAIKNKKEDIGFALQLLDTILDNKLKEQIQIPELKKLYLGKVLEKLNELKEAVKNTWGDESKAILKMIISKVNEKINESDKPEEKGVGLRGRGTISISGLEEIGIGRIRRW